MITKFLKENHLDHTLSTFENELQRMSLDEEPLYKDTQHPTAGGGEGGIEHEAQQTASEELTLENLVRSAIKVNDAASHDEPYATFSNGSIAYATCAYLSSNLLAYNRDMPNFLRRFCTMYRAFASCEYVLGHLVQIVKQSKPMTRVATVSKFLCVTTYWMTKYPSDFNRDAISIMRHFTQWFKCQAWEITFQNWDRFLQTFNQICTDDSTRAPTRPLSIHNSLLVSMDNIMDQDFDIFEVSAIEISQQITLIYYGHYSGIDTCQLIHTVWRRDSPFHDLHLPICKLLELDRMFQQWIENSIATTKEEGDKTTKLVFFAKMLLYFTEYNNHIGAVAIYKQVHPFMQQLREGLQQIDNLDDDNIQQRIEDQFNFIRTLLQGSESNILESTAQDPNEFPTVPFIQPQITNLETIQRRETRARPIIFKGRDDRRKDITLVNWTYMTKIFPSVRHVEQPLIRNRVRGYAFPFVSIEEIQSKILNEFMRIDDQRST